MAKNSPEIQLSFLPKGKIKPFVLVGQTIQGVINQLPQHCPGGASTHSLYAHHNGRWLPLNLYLVKQRLTSPFSLQSL